MILSDDQRREVIGARMANAREALADAETLAGSGSLRGAANRVYYSMFYAVSALAILRGQSFKKHAALISFFHREYIKSGMLDRKHGRALQKAFDDRSEADYEDHVEFTDEQVTGRIQEARDLIQAAVNHIESRLNSP